MNDRQKELEDFTAELANGRMMADGIPPSDVDEARELIATGELDWFDFWSERSRLYERIGEEAVAKGHTITGGEWIWLGSLTSHYAQFMWFHDAERRAAGQNRKADLYERAAPHFDPPAERVELTVDGITIPGYLRLPEGASKAAAPCVLLIGGLESTKEESYLFENMCLRRGMATFAFDGPGQGEVFFELPLQPDFDRYASATIDYLETRDEVDSERLGVLGRSLGGYYAPFSAARDQRLKAAVSWGACYDMSEFDRMPERTRDGFLFVTGIADPAEARKYLESAIDFRPVAEDIRCPFYVLHGVHDAIFSMDHVKWIEETVTNAPLELVIEENGNHCCHNMGHIVRPRMADWLQDQLKG